MTSPFTHQPVLLDECLAWLAPRSGDVVVDGTVGGGGHAEAILTRSAPHGRLVGLDLDPQAIAAAATRLGPFGDRVRLVEASFRELRSVLDALRIERVDGILLDLGVSSPQLDTPARGFRFDEDTAAATPLDMRMGAGVGPAATTRLREASAEELARWFHEYADLPGSRRLARAIVAARERAPIETSADLLAVIRDARVGGGRRHHPATLVFQAIRIAVNDELGALAQGIEAGIECLRPGGRLVVVAYHSVEDRIVKNGLRDAVRGCVCPSHVPVCICGGRVRLRLLTRRPVRPSTEEVRRNPRSRSARLRAAERVAEAA